MNECKTRGKESARRDSAASNSGLQIRENHPAVMLSSVLAHNATAMVR